MSKDKSKNSEEDVFGAFKLLRGEFIPPVDNNPSDETPITTDNEDVISEDEQARMAEADRLLKEQEEKLTKKQKKEKEPESEPVEDVVEDEETEEEEEPETNSPYKLFGKSLIEKSILDITEEELGETEEDLEKAVDKTVQNRINKWASTLPEDYTRFLEYVQAGGTPKDFLDIYYGNHSWETFNLESDDNQKLVVRESLKLAGETDEDIDEMIEEWFDNGTLEKHAKKAIVKLKKHEEEEKENLLVQQKKLEADKRKAEQDYWDNFKKEVYSKKEIQGFKVNEKTKDKLWEFMSVPDKKTGKTGYQKAVEANQDATLLFAYLAMNNFDISSLEKQVNSKVSKKLADTLKNFRDTKDRISGGGSREAGGSNPFEAFKNAKF